MLRGTDTPTPAKTLPRKPTERPPADCISPTNGFYERPAEHSMFHDTERDTLRTLHGWGWPWFWCSSCDHYVYMAELPKDDPARMHAGLVKRSFGHGEMCRATMIRDMRYRGIVAEATAKAMLS